MESGRGTRLNTFKVALKEPPATLIGKAGIRTMHEGKHNHIFHIHPCLFLSSPSSGGATIVYWSWEISLVSPRNPLA